MDGLSANFIPPAVWKVASYQVSVTTCCNFYCGKRGDCPSQAELIDLYDSSLSTRSLCRRRQDRASHHLTDLSLTAGLHGGTGLGAGLARRPPRRVGFRRPLSGLAVLGPCNQASGFDRGLNLSKLYMRILKLPQIMLAVETFPSRNLYRPHHVIESYGTRLQLQWASVWTVLSKQPIVRFYL